MQQADTRILTGLVESSIEIDRPAAKIFAMFADADRRASWLRLPGRDRTAELDFREGGSELRTSVFPNTDHDEVLEIRNRFVEIESPRRIVELVEIRLDRALRTASLVAWEFASTGAGTEVRYTEQYQVLVPTGDGSADHGERKGAVPMMLRGLKIAAERD